VVERGQVQRGLLIAKRGQIQRGLLITKLRIDGECEVCTNDVYSHIRRWCACITMMLNCVSMSLYTTVSRCGVCTAVNGFVPLTGRRTHLVLHYIYIVFTTPGRMPHRPHSLEPKSRVSRIPGD
jgi:hypothetical protein